MNAASARPSFFHDKAFFRTLFRLALPIAVQQALFCSLDLTNGVMVGQLGETRVAAVGLANQVSFVLGLMLFGVGSGAAVFAAQFWGRTDLANIRRVLGLCLVIGLVGSLLFAGVALFFPSWALSIYSRDPAVIALGSGYLRIAGLSYLAMAITNAYSAILRSTEQVALPTAVSAGTLLLSCLMNYLLIFGRLGLPVLGINGVAVSLCIARYLECIFLLILVYRRHTAAAASLAEMTGLPRGFLSRFLRKVLPVVVGELLWSLGVTVYNVIYAHVGTNEAAIMSIATAIESLAMVTFIAMMNAAAIMIGNRVGAGEEHKALAYSKRFLVLGIAGALLVGAVVLAVSGPILSLYKIEPASRMAARYVLAVLAGVMWLKASNMNIIVGTLRSGGDTLFAFFLDAGSMWFVGVPLALLGAFVLHLPLYGIVLLLSGDELFKFSVGLWRVFSRKWIQNLAQPAPARPD